MVKDKVTIITGAASGIGLEIAKIFAKEEAKLILADMNTTKLESEVQSLQAQDVDCMGITVDVTNEDDIQRMIQQTVEHYGRIDILFNNAGLQHIDSIESFATDKFRQMIDIMLVGSFMAMKKQQSGRILNMASINGVIGFAGKAAYNSAKHGIIGLTKVAALENATDGITVNALCPGYVDTPLVRNQMAELAKNRGTNIEDVLDEVLYPLIPQKRLLQVSEIADYALFLASDKAKSVTGQAVLIDGGYTAQ